MVICLIVVRGLFVAIPGTLYRALMSSDHEAEIVHVAYARRP